MASFGNEGLDVEREAGLQRPEPLEADGGSEGDIGNEEAGEEGEGEAESGGCGRNPGGDGVAAGLEVGGLDGGPEGGDGGVEEKRSGEEGEEEVGG